VNSVFTKRSVEYCLADLVDKVGDAKNGAAVQETLSCLAECTSLDHIALQVHTQTSKNRLTALPSVVALPAILSSHDRSIAGYS